MLSLHDFNYTSMKYKIHQEGKSILITSFAIFLFIDVLTILFLPHIYAQIAVVSITIILYLVLVNFFRSPRRHFVMDNVDYDRVVVAPADGTVVVCEEVYEGEYFQDRRIQVSIFMSVFNVHVNWSPINGEVLSVRHQDGRYLAANLPKSSMENERSHIVIKARNGQEILMRQIAGAIAQRIVTYPDAGEECMLDEHMGFIKFGSRVDLFLPLDCEIRTHIEAKTVGNHSLIAYLSDKQPQ